MKFSGTMFSFIYLKPLGIMKNLLKKRFQFRSSIYGQVVITITLLSIFLFVSFGVIFNSVNQKYLNTVITQNSNNISSIVEGALYHSMLENDRGQLQNTIDIINTMPGIEDVNMYDSLDNLVYTSFPNEKTGHNNPNCKDCHNNIQSMFPRKVKSYKIVNIDSECEMDNKNYAHRMLLIKSPILNEKSCYTAACHEHQESDEILGSIMLRIPLEELDAAVSESSSNFFMLAALTTLILVGALILFTQKKIKTPLKEIIKASIAVSNGDRDTRLKVEPKQLHDMKMVSSAFNNMLDNLQAATEELKNWSQQLEYKVQKKSEEIMEMQSELIHVERIASLGKLSSSVAHEINNPLSGILTYSKLIQKYLKKPELNEKTKESALKHLKVIEHETKRCGEIVSNLLEFSRDDQSNFKTKSLHNVLTKSYALLEHKFKMSNINYLTDFSAHSDLISCNENQIKQACVALLLNAYEAISDNGEILIKTFNPDDKNISFSIRDNGIGIAPDAISNIFQPFFSTKQETSGIGLGLAIVHGIIQNHKGKIEVDSELGKWTSFMITLPLVKQ